MQRDSVTKVSAVVCCLPAFAGLAALVVLVLALGLDLWPTPGEPTASAAWLVDIGLLGTFGLQHSGMARQAFKRLWTRIVPGCLERSLYAAASGIVLLGVCWWWQPLGGEPLWRLPVVLEGGALLGAVGLLLLTVRFDGPGLLGLRQAWQRGGPTDGDPLLIVGPYRWVRHPLMACLLVFLWCHPIMPTTLVLLSGGFTVYILLALVLEERDLIRRFGPAYRAYRSQVPAVVPWRAPAPWSKVEEIAP
jgi:methanethiol S-methyltransferase